MGGMGSGRHWQYGAKEATDDYRSIDIRRWKRDGLLIPKKFFSWKWSRNGETVASINVRVEADRIILNYKSRDYGEDWQNHNYPVYLDWTLCNLGGKRPWFLCPAKGCNQRIAILYYGSIFACRHCFQLVYPSQREAVDDRITRKADKIREKLDWEPGILNANGLKPKGMHWDTYTRLVAEHDYYVEISLYLVTAKFGAYLERN